MSDKNHRRPPQGGGGGVGGGSGGSGGGNKAGFWKGLAHTKEVWLTPMKELARDISADVKEALRPGGAGDAHASLRASAHDKRKHKETLHLAPGASLSRPQHGPGVGDTVGGGSSAKPSGDGVGDGGGGGGGGGDSSGRSCGGLKGQGQTGAGAAGKQLNDIFASLDPADGDEEQGQGQVVAGGLNEGRGHKRNGHGGQHDHEGTTVTDMMTEAADALKSDLSVSAAFEKIKAMRGGGGSRSGGGVGGEGVGVGGSVSALFASVTPLRWEPVPVPEPVRRIAAAAAAAVRGQLYAAAAAAAVFLLVVVVIAGEHTSAAAVQHRGSEAHAVTHAAVHPALRPEINATAAAAGGARPSLAPGGPGLAPGPGPAPAPGGLSGDTEATAAAAMAAGGASKTEASVLGPPDPAVALLRGTMVEATRNDTTTTAEAAAAAAGPEGAPGPESLATGPASSAAASQPAAAAPAAISPDRSFLSRLFHGS